MNFQVEILSVVGPVKNQKGKNTWNAVEVAYKKDGKIEGKKLADFNGDKNYDALAKEVFAKACLAKQGEVYNVQAEKINDFWNWIGFTKQDGAAAQAPAESKAEPVESSKGVATPPEQASGRGTSRVTGSNYETPEERTVKQRYIARQSSLGYALQFFALSKTKEVHPDDVEALAERFVAFVYKTDAVKGLVEMDNDIPY